MLLHLKNIATCKTSQAITAYLWAQIFICVNFYDLCPCMGGLNILAIFSQAGLLYLDGKNIFMTISSVFPDNSTNSVMLLIPEAKTVALSMYDCSLKEKYLLAQLTKFAEGLCSRNSETPSLTIS